MVIIGTDPARGGRYAMLAPLPSEKVNVSFFDQNSKTGEPDYEASMRYWRNGVADDLSMDFGDFTMGGTLQALTPGTHPC